MFVFPPTLSLPHTLFGFALLDTQKMVQRSLSLSSFPAIESGKFQLPMKFLSTLPMAFDPVVKKRTKPETKNRKCWQISCVCYTWFDKDVIPSVGVHASSGVCPQTYKTFLYFFRKKKKVQNEIFYFLVIQSVLHHWSGFVLPGEF